ncbi:MAG: glycosyltransferase family 4 protein [Methanoregula sp.]
MKIAQISATFPPYMAGTGNVCYHNAVELAARGHEVTIFTSGNSDDSYPYPSSLNVNRIRPVIRIGNAPFIPSLLKIHDFDIIHLHFPFFFGGELIYFLSKFTKQKYLITYHNDVVLGGKIKPFLKLYKRTVMSVILKNAKKICVSSLDYGHNCELSNYSGSIMDSIIEIPIGVDTNIFNPTISSDEIKERYKVYNKKIILFVAGLDSAHYFKGLENLLISFSHITDETARLMIIGDGNLKFHYIKLSNELGISDKVIFTGGVSNEDLPKCYACAELLVLPSISSGEAFGLVLIEAMACGKPVIASNLPGVRTVVDHNVNGLLVEPGDVKDLTAKIDYLLHNEDICKSFGREGRKKTEEKYSWKRIAEKLEHTYFDILSRDK